MKWITRLLYLPVVGMLFLSSCAKDQTESYDKFEDQALEAWMTQNRPDLLGNLQSEGGYYVDVLAAGETLSDEVAPIRDTACWVRFDFSGRDLSGNIILTRRAAEARLVNTFTKYTHYVPYYRYCGVANTSLLEGSYLAMRNVLHLDEEYARKRGLDPEFELRKGSKVVLYMPSRIVGASGVEGDGGYEGQYSLSSKRPFIVEMVVKEIVKNPLESEGSDVDSFCEANGGLWFYTKEEDEDEANSSEIPTGYDDENHPYKLRDKGFRWVSVNDTLAQVYVDLLYDPTKAEDNLKFDFPVKSEEGVLLRNNQRYDVGFTPYDGSDLETKIAEVLKERFHSESEEGYKHPGLADREADSVGMDGEAKIWYIARFLDGFIFDTNIDEVKELIYGEISSEGSALTYTPESDQTRYISAFYYSIPNLCYGQWAEFVTVSSQAYGATGQAGSTTTEGGSTGYSASYLDYLNYYNYYNSYYGNSYYGSYYDNYYYNYYNSYYYNYGYGYGDTSTETTTTISTEIPPYTPLIFQIYVEPADE